MGTDPIDLSHLDNLIFNVFDPLQADEPSDDLDPDEGFFSHQNQPNSNCNYIHPDPLAKIITDWHSPPNISFFHLNARSLKRNFNDICTLLHTINHPFTLLGFTETWFKEHNAPIHNIDGYTHEFITRQNKPGGGTSMYISTNISYQLRHDLTYSDDDCEMLWVELDSKDLHTAKNYIVGTIYRRPGTNIAHFNTILTEKLHTISLENKPTIHMGDYNLDLLKSDTHPQTKKCACAI
jgi:exonuclease III